jgi:tetratricopeptide (TPR) repeat protein
VARLNLRGVSAMNRNDRKAARDSFEQAYKMDPKNSFALNNMGYLAELEGDTETAQSFYEQAQRAERARQKVMVSTRPEVEGQTVGHVAEQSTTLVESAFEAKAEARRRSGAPPALRTRDNRIIVEPKTPPPSTNTTPPEFRNPPQREEEPAVAAPQSDQPQQNQPPANNEPQLKTRPAQRPPDSQQQNPPQQNSQPPQD